MPVKRTCNECGQEKPMSAFEGTPKTLGWASCYGCWNSRGKPLSSPKVFSSKLPKPAPAPPQPKSSFGTVDEGSALTLPVILLIGIVLVVGAVLIHQSNPCNVLPPSDHRVSDYVKQSSGSVSFDKISEGTGLSLGTVRAAAQRLEECGKVQLK